MSVPTFVVGSARCGSTMISNMLREHPKVLSLSEFFSSISDSSPHRTSEIFSSDQMSGRRFWGVISAITPTISFALRHRIELPEFLYPCDSPDARFSRETGVPGILHITLPHLTDAPDVLFTRLEREVIDWPEASLGEHYRHLFDWLKTDFAKQRWVERSGGFLGSADTFAGLFPDARFVHIVRDGRDTALSMREHRGFKVAFVMASLEKFLGVNPLLSSDRSQIGNVPEQWLPFLPEAFDVDAFHAFRLPLSFFARLWSEWMAHGLAQLPSEGVLTLRYEDILRDPTPQLDALTRFLGNEFIDNAWVTRCSATVRPPRSTWRDLPQDEAHTLTEACRPGFEALKQAGVRYAL